MSDSDSDDQEELPPSNYHVAFCCPSAPLGGTSKRWRDCDAQMSDTDSDDHNQEEPPPGFSRNADDATDIKRLRTVDGQQLQDNYEDPSSFFNYYGNLFISVETDEAVYDVMYTHPVLKQFQIQEAYNNNSDYNSESEDNYQTCIRCNYTFPCPVTYQGNQPICITCSAELRH